MLAKDSSASGPIVNRLIAMIAFLAIAAASFSTPSASALALAPIASTPLLAIQAADAEAEFTKRFEAAGKDVDKLWELHTWAKDQSLIMKARDCLKKIVEVDPTHEEAHKVLGHHFYDNKWFNSYYELTEYKRDEEKRMLEEKGLVRYQDKWVPQEDLPFLRMGKIKVDGVWIGRREHERKLQEAKYIADGWKQQSDLVWVPPDELGNWEKGLWKCGDRWLDIKAADEYHSEMGRWWTLPSPSKAFHIWSTVDMEGTRWAAYWADQTYRDLERIFGLKPKSPPHVLVMNTINQYNLFGGGDQQSNNAGTDRSGNGALHYAFFAEAWISPDDPPEYLGTGACYWDRNDPNLSGYGQLAVRHAAGLAYVEAIDPSTNTVAQFVAGTGGSTFDAGSFYGEKKIPGWIRYGAASYVERFYKDMNPPEGYTPYHMRDWALDQIRRSGGRLPLREIFDFQLDSNNGRDKSIRILIQSGLVMCFVLEGNNPQVMNAHRDFKAALAAGKDTTASVQALQKAILDNEDSLQLFARMD